MSRDPNRSEPSQAPASPQPAPASEESVGRGHGTHERGDSEEEEQVRDVDPHPDTPDDFDDDATVGRESIEAVPEDDD